MREFVAGFIADTQEKLAISPEYLLRALKGVKGQIRAMGIPVTKSVTPLTFTTAPAKVMTPKQMARVRAKPTLVTTATGSPRAKYRKRMPRAMGVAAEAMGGTSEAMGEMLQLQMRGWQKGLRPKEKEIMGRIFMAHEKAEAQALRGLGGKMKEYSPAGHMSPSVLEREYRIVRLIGKKYPRIKRRFGAARFAEKMQLEGMLQQAPKEMIPAGLKGKTGQRWADIYERYLKGVKEKDVAEHMQMMADVIR